MTAFYKRRAGWRVYLARDWQRTKERLADPFGGTRAIPKHLANLFAASARTAKRVGRYLADDWRLTGVRFGARLSTLNRRAEGAHSYLKKFGQYLANDWRLTRVRFGARFATINRWAKSFGGYLAKDAKATANRMAGRFKAFSRWVGRRWAKLARIPSGTPAGLSPKLIWQTLVAVAFVGFVFWKWRGVTGTFSIARPTLPQNVWLSLAAVATVAGLIVLLKWFGGVPEGIRERVVKWEVVIGIALVTIISLALFYTGAPDAYRSFLHSGFFWYTLFGLAIGGWLKTRPSSVAKRAGTAGMVAGMVALTVWLFPYLREGRSTTRPTVSASGTRLARTTSASTNLPPDGPYKRLTEEEFGMGHVMVAVAGCESGWHHFDPRDTTQVLRNRQGSDAQGLYQVRTSVHGERARTENLDLGTPEGQVRMARILYDSVGTAPWLESRGCWQSEERPFGAALVRADTISLSGEWTRPLPIPRGVTIVSFSLYGKAYEAMTDAGITAPVGSNGCLMGKAGIPATTTVSYRTLPMEGGDNRIVVEYLPEREGNNLLRRRCNIGA